MKRLYILASLLLLASSCVREEQAMNPESSVDPTVPIVLSFQEPVTLQARTRAGLGTEMGVTPAIESIHVAVFGSSGYLKDYASAVPCDQYGNTSGAGYADKNYTGTDSETTTASSSYFLVRLPANLEESLRRVHIIANGPSSLPFNAGEDEIMKSMSVKDGNGAYWQRIVLPKGILATQEDGAYRADPEVERAFTGIKLVRNFACVTVGETASNFYLESLTLCNMPKSGSVAMYSDNHGDWIYSTDKGLENGMLWSAYEQLSPNQYDQPGYNSDFPEGFIVYADNNGASHSYGGFPLNPELDTYIPSTAEDYAAAGLAVSASATDETQPYDTQAPPVYVYERAVTTENPPFILLKGTWVDPEGKTEQQVADALEAAVQNQTSSYYYRLDITKDSDYVPIYRNYQYNITITGVELKGYDTPGEAALHSSGDNFSVALDTEILADVSNGKIHLFVEKPFIDLTYTSEPQKFWFRLLDIATQNAINSGANVTITEREGGNALASFSWERGSGADVDADGDGNAKERWVNFTLNPAEFGETESMRSSTLKIVGSYASGGKTYKLVREVTIRVYNPNHVQLSLNPETVAAKEGETTTLGIPLPLNLQRSMFPLEILVSDSDKSLNPAAKDMFVKTESPTYGFVYTLNWSDYQRMRDNALRADADAQYAMLNCDLKTIKSYEQYEASNDYETTVTASCLYFSGEAVLYADKDNLITPSKQEVVPPDRVAEVTVKSESAWSLSLKHADGTAVAGAVINPSTGAATTGTPVTITLPESSASNIEYIVTMTNATVTRTARILQLGSSITLELLGGYDDNPPTKILHGSGTGTDEYSNVVKVTSGVQYYLEYRDQAGGDWNRLNMLAQDATVENPRIQIPVNNTVAERTFVIRARDTHDPYILCSNEKTLIQEAGIATLTVNTPNLMLFESEASVNVSSSFPVVLKVFDSNGDPISGILVKDASNQEVGTTGGDDPVLLAANTAGANYTLVLPANLSGAAETLTVKLFNTDDVELRSGSIVHAGTPVLTLTEDKSIKGNVLTCDLVITSDEEWSITAAHGEKFSIDGSTPSSTISGDPTTGKTITVTLPSKNYNYGNDSDVNYPVTAASTESGSVLVATATITQRGATLHTDGSASFDTGNTRNSSDHGMYMQSDTHTDDTGRITGTFTRISSRADNGLVLGTGAQDYTELNRDSATLTLTREKDDVRAITGVTMSFTENYYTPTSITPTPSIGSGSINGTSYSWTGNDPTKNSITFTLNNTHQTGSIIITRYNTRITAFTVTYEYYTWD